MKYVITLFVFVLFVLLTPAIVLLFFSPKVPPVVTSCKCLTISEILLHIEKREMFVDKLQRCKMSERSAIIDSINYHNAVLDSTGNKIEY